MAKKITRTQELMKPGWAIPRSLKEMYVDWCEENAPQKLQEGFAGALFLWMYLPENLREAAKSSGLGKPILPIDTWKRLRNLPILQYLLNNSPDILAAIEDENAVAKRTTARKHKPRQHPA